MSFLAQKLHEACICTNARRKSFIFRTYQSIFPCFFRTSCIASCFVLKYFCEIFTCASPSFLNNIFRSHDAWPVFFWGGGDLHVLCL